MKPPTYKVKRIHISVKHAHALCEFEVGVWVGRVHVEYVVEPVVVELAYSGVRLGVRSMLSLVKLDQNTSLFGLIIEKERRALCMYLILRRKNGSGRMLPQVKYLDRYQLPL